MSGSEIGIPDLISLLEGEMSGRTEGGTASSNLIKPRTPKTKNLPTEPGREVSVIEEWSDQLALWIAEICHWVFGRRAKVQISTDSTGVFGSPSTTSPL